MARPIKYTEEELLEILRSVGKENISKIDVDSNPLLPGSMTIIRKFGSWNRAVKLAGLKPGRKTGRKVKKITKPNLMDRKKKWEGGIDFPETGNIENDIENTYAGDLLIWKGQELTRKFLRSIDEDMRDEIAKDVLNFFMKYDFIKNFKYRDSELQSSFKSLKKTNVNIFEEDGVNYITNVGAAGYKLYRNYFPNIIKVRGDNRRSIYDALTDKELLWSVIRNRIGNTLLYGGDENKDIGYCQYPMNINPSQIVIGSKNSGIGNMASIFKPSVAKDIYKRYVKDYDTVLDYSCGFGTRLLGLMACGFEGVKYCGYEPNTETYGNLLNLINVFNFNAEIKCCGSEEELFDEKFDFVFSSPPYYSQEIYTNEETQSVVKFPEYNSWLEGYWRKTVKNIKTMMKSDGVFGINIGGNSNDLMKKLENDMNGIIIEEGFELINTIYMKTSKSHLSGKKGDSSKKFKLEGMFFYKKGERNGNE